ncbi:MAG: hypothetical protein A2X12_02500 [Bacteroidetes bacterium GWE2_29_8]|nr:MAG: hypothetical protein A2X12_02500 [Bacteroidetes bacterium GWE2_29_8]OFY23052.1 MAG: hypothetical protein A2X02_09480 [Bacteroidetes bacterium GWF2_29_10]
MSLFANAQVNNVGINETGENPNAAAMLDIKSANKGILIPRMNLADTTLVNNVKTLSNDEKGLLIFAQDKKMFYYWDGAKWLSILSTNFYNSGYGITIGNDGSIIVDTTLLANKNHNHTGVYEPILTKGDLTTSSPISITGGTGAIIGTGTSVSISKANGTTDGYIAKEDWNVFNNKLDTIIQGNGIIISGNTIYVDTNKFDNKYAPMNDSLTNHIATPWRIFYSNASGKVEELVLGNTGMVLTSAGMANAPEWAKAIEIDTAGFSVTGIINFYTSGDTVSLTVKGDKGDAGAIGPQGPAGASDVSNLQFIVSNDTVILVNDSAGFITYLDTVVLPASQSAWLIEGNTGTTPATNFLGTKDNNDLVVKTNNAERMRITKGGKVTINDTLASAGSVVNIISKIDTTGLYVENRSAVSPNFAIVGESSSNDGVGIFGQGKLFGVYGILPADGIQLGAAIQGANMHPDGIGVIGTGNGLLSGIVPQKGSGGAFSGTEIGVYGISTDNNIGIGVYGLGNDIGKDSIPINPLFKGSGGFFIGQNYGSVSQSYDADGVGAMGYGIKAGVMGEGTVNGLKGIGYKNGVNGIAYGVYGNLYKGDGVYGLIGQTSQDGMTIDPEGTGIWSVNNIEVGSNAGAGVSGNGDIYALGTLYQGSDRRLKKDIKPLDIVMSKLMKLEPSQYKFIYEKENNPKVDLINYGFIAQDFELTFPNLVNKPRKEGGFYSINYVGLIPIVVKGMQEQQEIINSLVRQNNELLNRIEKLEKRVIR